MTTDEKRYQNWPDLVLYTKEFKEWVWKLFRKVHARIGHVEEELAHIRETVKTDYQLEPHQISEYEIRYDLVDVLHPDEDHGSITINDEGGISIVTWAEDHE